MTDRDEPSDRKSTNVTRIHARRNPDNESELGENLLLPPGKLSVVVTYLEMVRPPNRSTRSRRLEVLSVVKAHFPTVSFYRYLYNTVGERWLWHERRKFSDRELGETIHDPNVEIYVLYLEGVPAGFVEFTTLETKEIDVSYFGLIPEFIGRGLGPWFLDWAVGKAWAAKPRKLLVNTCNLDHPKAIAVYQRAGFKPVRQNKILIDDPRETGIMTPTKS